MNIREPCVAGTFYTNNEEALKKELEYVSTYQEDLKPFAIIVPHAGHVYSGDVAGEVYKRVSKNYEKIIILAPNHTTYTQKAVIDDNDFWKTPFGLVKIWKPSFSSSVFEFNEEVHKKEHSIEVHLPFLQLRLKNFSLLPLIIGDLDDSSFELVANEICELLDEKTLLVVSTDLSHFLNDFEARRLDEETIRKILSREDVASRCACGAKPIRVANIIFKKKKKFPELLAYKNSGEVFGDKTSVVGYAGFIIK